MVQGLAQKAARASGEPDCTLAREDFDLVAEIIRREAGIVLREHKLDMVRGRLVRRTRELGLDSIGAYCARLRGPELTAELPGLLNALTTNHTAFFREPHHFVHMRETALPHLCPGGPRRMGRFRIWCAAASSGEEPYTIAGSVRAWLGAEAGPDCLILATDIDSEVLAKAERATYQESAFERLSPEERACLQLSASGSGEFRIGNALKAMVRFRQLNILGEWPFAGPFHIIFCRNMLIYFDMPTKLAVVARLTEMLVPGGYLYLGHSEALASTIPGLRAVGRTTYQRA